MLPLTIMVMALRVMVVKCMIAVFIMAVFAGFNGVHDSPDINEYCPSPIRKNYSTSSERLFSVSKDVVSKHFSLEREVINSSEKKKELSMQYGHLITSYKYFDNKNKRQRCRLYVYDSSELNNTTLMLKCDVEVYASGAGRGGVHNLFDFRKNWQPEANCELMTTLIDEITASLMNVKGSD